MWNKITKLRALEPWCREAFEEGGGVGGFYMKIW